MRKWCMSSSVRSSRSNCTLIRLAAHLRWTSTKGTLDKSATYCWRFLSRWGRAGGYQPTTNHGSRAVRCEGDKFTRPVRYETREDPCPRWNTGMVYGQGEGLRPISARPGCPHHGAFSTSGGTHPPFCTTLCPPVYVLSSSTGDGTHRP